MDVHISSLGRPNVSLVSIANVVCLEQYRRKGHQSLRGLRQR